MKTTRKIAKNKFFASIMSFMLLFATTYNANASASISTYDKEISGEQMFREIFFLQGGTMSKSLPKAVQQEYASLENLSKEQKLERSKLVNNVVSLINENNSSYFNTLKKVILDKNHYQIKEQLAVGGDLIINALNLQVESKKISEYLKDKKIDLSNTDEVNKLVKELNLDANNYPEGGELKMQTCIAVAIVVVLAFALAAVAAAITVFVEVINYAHISAEKGSLKAEEYINSIILNYA